VCVEKLQISFPPFFLAHALLKPKFHYADFATKSGTQIMKVRNTNHNKTQQQKKEKRKNVRRSVQDSSLARLNTLAVTLFLFFDMRFAFNNNALT